MLTPKPVEYVGIDPDADRFLSDLVKTVGLAPVLGGRLGDINRIGNAVERAELRFLLRCQGEPITQSLLPHNASFHLTWPLEAQ
jgi:hypothetical protein